MRQLWLLALALAAAAPASALAAFPGQNGLIAYKDTIDYTNPGIWTRHADGSNPTALVASHGADDPAWSADGTHIAYDDSSADFSFYAHVMIADADGSSVVDLSAATGLPANTSDRYPSWSPDGSHVAVLRAGAVWVLGRDGSAQQAPAAIASVPQWSPDGSKILYFGSDGALYVAGADALVGAPASTPLRITSASSGLGHPDWAPDGSAIAVGYTSGIETVSSSTGATIHSFAAPHASSSDYDSWWEPVFSPDGKQLAFDVRHYNGSFGPIRIDVMPSDGSATPTTIDSDSTSSLDRSPSWQVVPGTSTLAGAGGGGGGGSPPAPTPGPGAGPSAWIQNIAVTQGVQQLALPALDDPQPAAGARSATYPESAVALAAGGKTIVRVFVRSASGARVELDAADDNTGTHLGNPILPVNTAAPDLADAAAEDKQLETGGAFEFVLPKAWTGVAKLRLVANLMAGDGTSDSLVLHGVHFHKTAPVALRLVALTDNGALPPAPQAQIDQALALVPEDAAAPAAPGSYDAQVEISDLLHCPKCVNRETVNARVLQRMRAWSNMNPAQSANDTMAVAADDRLGISSGVIGTPLPPLAVVSITDRPYTEVGHELFHNLGLHHTGRECPLNSDGTAAIGNPSGAIAWPPDDRGYEHGIGLDRRAQDADGFFPVVAAPSPLHQSYDLMSYCAHVGDGDPFDWLSPESWQAAIATLNSLPASRSGARARAAGAAASGLLVDGFAVDGQTAITDVGPAAGAARPAGEPSGMVLRAYDRAGRSLGDAPVLAEYAHVNRGSAVQLLSARAPRAAAAVAFVAGGKVLARRARSAHAPTVRRLTLRFAGAGIRRALQLRWRSSDRDHDRLLARVDVSGDRRHWSSVYLGPDRHAARIGSSMLPGRRTFARVTLDDGFNQTTTRPRAVPGHHR